MVLVCLQNRKEESREGREGGREGGRKESRKVYPVFGTQLVKNAIQILHNHMNFFVFLIFQLKFPIMVLDLSISYS